MDAVPVTLVRTLLLSCLLAVGCAPGRGAPPASAEAVGPTPGIGPGSTSRPPDAPEPASGGRAWHTARAGEVEVQVLVERPSLATVDALLVYHGTVGRDALVPGATERTLDAFQRLLDRPDVMLVSVAYPEEGRPFGDNLREAEAAMLWVRDAAPAELGITVRRIYLAGHSQGGSLVVRLNATHAVDGVIANAPGPLDLVYRCGLEARGEAPRSVACAGLTARFGAPTVAPEAYVARSLLHVTTGQRSNLLVIQGMDDSPIQLHTWPIFRAQLEACEACRSVEFLELPGFGHTALFESPEAGAAFRSFLRRP